VFFEMERKTVRPDTEATFGLATFKRGPSKKRGTLLKPRGKEGGIQKKGTVIPGHGGGTEELHIRKSFLKERDGGLKGIRTERGENSGKEI